MSDKTSDHPLFLTREEVEKIQPKDVHRVLSRVMLVDGFDLVRKFVPYALKSCLSRP